jgi:hypothetical protein
LSSAKKLKPLIGITVKTTPHKISVPLTVWQDPDYGLNISDSKYVNYEKSAINRETCDYELRIILSSERVFQRYRDCTKRTGRPGP